VRQKLNRVIGGAAVLAILVAAAAPGRAAQAERVIQSGEVLALRMTAALSSKTSRAGDKFAATVFRDVRIDGVVVVPVGTTVEGHVTAVEPAKRLSRSGTIAVDFDRLVFKDGRSIPIVGQLTSLDPEQRRQIDEDEGQIQGGDTTKRNVIFIGGGAGAGAIIGAVSGSAGAGAGIGAGLGTAAVLLSKGNEAQIDPGFEYGLELLRAVRVPAAGSAGFGSRDDLLYAQAYLRDIGYYAGPLDGKLTSTTKAALLRFQRAGRLAETGTLDAATARAIGLVDDASARTEAVKVVSVDTRPAADGGLDVTLAASTNTGGWTVSENHFVTRDTLHVYVRGVGPDGPATQAITRHDVRFTLGPDDARAASRYVVHGAGADLTGDVGAAGGARGPDLRALSQRVGVMLANYERALGVRTLRTGAVAVSGRDYTEPEMELYFAVNSLAGSLQLYASIAESLRDPSSLHGADQVIVRAARQVDRAIGRAGTARTTSVERDWTGMRQEFADLAQAIGASLDRDER
jgi:peptidoglycan hydrolase-like protein with peptidoglycan-binding domain